MSGTDYTKLPPAEAYRLGYDSGYLDAEKRYMVTADTPDPRPDSLFPPLPEVPQEAYEERLRDWSDPRPVSPPSELTAAWSTLNTYIIRCGNPAMGTPTWNDALDALEVLSRAARVHEHDAARAAPQAAHPDDGHEHWYGCLRCGVDNGINERAAPQADAHTLTVHEAAGTNFPRCSCGAQGYDLVDGSVWFAQHVDAASPAAPAGLDVETRDLIDRIILTHGPGERGWRGRAPRCVTCGTTPHPCTARLLADRLAASQPSEDGPADEGAGG